MATHQEFPLEQERELFDTLFVHLSVDFGLPAEELDHPQHAHD